MIVTLNSRKPIDVPGKGGGGKSSKMHYLYSLLEMSIYGIFRILTEIPRDAHHLHGWRKVRHLTARNTEV